MTRWILLPLWLIASATVHGHHSFSAEFDGDKVITVTGNVLEVRYRNPHVQYVLEVDSGGEEARWIVAGQNTIVMGRAGVNGSTIDVGDEISITGYAGRDGAQKVYLETLITADGTRYAMYGDNAKRAVARKNIEEAKVSGSSLFAALSGHWSFDVDKPLPGAPLHLLFELEGGKMQAILDNEVIDVEVGVDSFSMVLSRENRAGFPARLQLTGTVDGDAIEGDVNIISGYSNFAELDATSFSAVRTTSEIWDAKPFVPAAPVDLTGVWERSIVLGPLGRTNAHLNEAGMARHREYSKGAYDPLLRCMSAGPMRRQTRRGNLEILATINRLTLIYANGNAVRRLWFDRDQHSNNREHDIMGESLATWDGSTLVVETRNLTETVLTHNSEPISRNARIVERLWLNDAGDLIMEATLLDPTYYERPVVKRLQWSRTEDRNMLYSPCDPDSFYRSLQFDGTFDGYFENQPKPVGE